MKNLKFLDTVRTNFRASGEVDAWFFSTLAALVAVGFFIFLSASIGLLARDGADFSTVAITRLAATVIGGTVAYLASLLHYKNFRRHSLLFLLASIALTVLVFVPGIGIEHAGAWRWISLFGISFQPAELLKIAFVIYAASLFSAIKERVQTFRYGMLPLLALSAISGLILLMQPDTDGFVVLFLALLSIFVVAGGRIRHVVLLGIIGGIALGGLILSKPYLKERIETFFFPQAADSKGAGWQIEQSLIAIGSGGFSGRGFGQSVQKFSYLPEPIGDSVFAVAAEEFGFAGGVFIILLFSAFLLRGLKIAVRSPDAFSGFLSVGIVVLIASSAFMNIASTLAVIPISGLPLAFVSHGGSSLVITLFEAGILLNVSRHQKLAV